MKAGANGQDIIKIVAMFGEGKKVKEISTSLGINRDVIVAFRPKATPAKK